MPFKKKGKYYYSPSGRKMTKSQVQAYYAKKSKKSNSKKKK